MDDQLMLFVFGAVLVAVIAYAALRRSPIGSEQQFFLLRVVVALAGAGVAAVLPGVLRVELGGATGISVRAAGALGVFVLLYLTNPPGTFASRKTDYVELGDARKDLNMPVVEALIRGDYRDAEFKARAYLTECPGSIRAAYNLAIALSNQAHADGAGERDPRMVEARELLQSVLCGELFTLLRDHEAIGDPVAFVMCDSGLRYLYLAFPGLLHSVLAYSSEFSGDMGTRGYGAPCFGASVPVIMFDRSSKPISAVNVGDVVLSASGDGHESVSRVTRIGPSTGVPLILNGELVVSPSQPVFTNRGEWVCAGDLRVGDEVRQAGGGSVRIDSVGLTRHPVRLFDLQVDRDHTYFAGGVLVHNKLSI